MPKREKGTRIRGSFARSGHRSHVKGVRRFMSGRRKNELQDKLASDAARLHRALVQRDGESARDFVRRVASSNPTFSQRAAKARGAKQ